MATDFRELRVWEEAMVLTEQVYQLVQRFPADERFGLTSQLKRASMSVPSCIAEGNGRGSIRDYLRFLSMAAGSLAEIQTQILLALRLGFVERKHADPCLAQHRSVSMLLQAMKNSLQRRSASVSAGAHSPFPVPRSPAL
ncbi:four helix bundle protein [Pseudoxanthomonas sp. UTMC 1351]|uniref:four helix bundle protein n=1 Tax=Pseudoxanthomonas sp. UTMC 1351 TaxID=2695853 RepID=UPI0034CEA654